MEALLITVIKKAMLSRLALGGIKGYVIQKLAEYFFNKVLEPVLKEFFDKVEHTVDKRKVLLSIKELQDAETESDFDTAVDNLS